MQKRFDPYESNRWWVRRHPRWIVAISAKSLLKLWGSSFGRFVGSGVIPYFDNMALFQVQPDELKTFRQWSQSKATTQRNQGANQLQSLTNILQGGNDHSECTHISFGVGMSLW